MMRVVAHPVPRCRGTGLKSLMARFPWSVCGGVAGACVLLFPGIKLFPTNLYDPSARIDTPLLTWRQIFGCSPISAPDGTTYLLRPVPRVIVFT